MITGLLDRRSGDRRTIRPSVVINGQIGRKSDHKKKPEIEDHRWHD
jgi:hypothetical protein